MRNLTGLLISKDNKAYFIRNNKTNHRQGFNVLNTQQVLQEDYNNVLKKDNYFYYFLKKEDINYSSDYDNYYSEKEGTIYNGHAELESKNELSVGKFLKCDNLTDDQYKTVYKLINLNDFCIKDLFNRLGEDNARFDSMGHNDLYIHKSFESKYPLYTSSLHDAMEEDYIREDKILYKEIVYVYNANKIYVPYWRLSSLELRNCDIDGNNNLKYKNIRVFDSDKTSLSNLNIKAFQGIRIEKGKIENCSLKSDISIVIRESEIIDKLQVNSKTVRLDDLQEIGDNIDIHCNKFNIEKIPNAQIDIKTLNLEAELFNIATLDINCRCHIDTLNLKDINVLKWQTHNDMIIDEIVTDSDNLEIRVENDRKHVAMFTIHKITSTKGSTIDVKVDYKKNGISFNVCGKSFARSKEFKIFYSQGSPIDG